MHVPRHKRRLLTAHCMRLCDRNAGFISVEVHERYHRDIHFQAFNTLNARRSVQSTIPRTSTTFEPLHYMHCMASADTHANSSMVRYIISHRAAGAVNTLWRLCRVPHTYNKIQYSRNVSSAF